MDNGRHKLSKNIWFVLSKMSYSGDMEGCHACGRRNVKIELEFWKQNSQYLVFCKVYIFCILLVVHIWHFVRCTYLVFCKV